jgi:hypothetical protein
MQTLHPSPYMPDNWDFTVFIFSLLCHIMALVPIDNCEQNGLLFYKNYLT